MADNPGPSGGPHQFYTAVSVETDGEAFGLRLDGRAPRSPGGRPLVLPTEALAEQIADEWRAQAETIDYRAMPATRLAHTALDAVSVSRAQSLEGVVRYAESDLLCYFAEGPASLARRQAETWIPLLDWVRETHGLALVRTAEIVHRAQPAESLERLAAGLARLDDFSLAGLAFAAPLLGSAVLALALRAGRLDAAAAMAASRLDEIFQEERWGVDAEAAKRAAAMTAEAVMADRWFAALGRGDELVTRRDEG